MKALFILVLIVFVVVLILPRDRESFFGPHEAIGECPCQGDTSPIFDPEHNLEIVVTGFNYSSVPKWYTGPFPPKDNSELVQVKPVDIYQDDGRSCSDSRPYGGYHYVFYAENIKDVPNYLLTSDDIVPTVWIGTKKANVSKAFEYNKGIMWRVKL